MEFLSEFITFLVNCLFWYFVISLVSGFLRQQLEAKEQTHTEQLKRLDHYIHRVQVEKHGDMYYWFDRDSDEFLAQGKTDTEIINHVKSRFPTHIFILNDEKGLRGPDWKVVPLQELTQK